VDEPLAGTAPERHTWIAIEQPGPWGADAWRASHLPEGVPADLPEQAAAQGVGVLLIRRPGRHADLHVAGPRTVIVANVAPTTRTVRRYFIDSDRLADAVAALDVRDIVTSADRTFGRTHHSSAPTHDVAGDSSTVLVCTHARRDACCALSGRALVDDLQNSAQHVLPQPVDLWECSHLGGHRFAPTALVLPQGLMLGRATHSDVVAALMGRPVVATMRGYTWRSAEAQVVESLVRADAADVGADLTIVREGGEGDRHVHVAHDGPERTWRARTWSADLPAEPRSCGTQPVSTRAIVGELIPAS
jgi:hypothetical protein